MALCVYYLTDKDGAQGDSSILSPGSSARCPRTMTFSPLDTPDLTSNQPSYAAPYCARRISHAGPCTTKSSPSPADMDVTAPCGTATHSRSAVTRAKPVSPGTRLDRADGGSSIRT